MEIVFLLVPVALALGFIFVAGFIWSTKSGQYDDLNTPAIRILNDEPVRKELDNE